jgi:hypothetical protein
MCYLNKTLQERVIDQYSARVEKWMAEENLKNLMKTWLITTFHHESFMISFGARFHTPPRQGFT